MRPRSVNRHYKLAITDDKPELSPSYHEHHAIEDMTHPNLLVQGQQEVGSPELKLMCPG